MLWKRWWRTSSTISTAGPRPAPSADDVTVDEAGAWTVDVRVWHDGRTSGGQTVPPYPTGDVLGSANGRYWFYAVPPGSAAPWPSNAS